MRRLSLRQRILVALLVGCILVGGCGTTAGQRATTSENLLPAPLLRSPLAGATMPQDNQYDACTIYGIYWRFEWDPILGAKGYQFEMEREGAQLPHAVALLDVTQNFAEVQRCGCFQADNLSNWRWRVRAKADNQLGTWSDWRPFNVEKFAGCTGYYMEK